MGWPSKRPSEFTPEERQHVHDLVHGGADKIVDRGEASGGAPPPPVNRYFVTSLLGGWVVRDAASDTGRQVVGVYNFKHVADGDADARNRGER